ncbi:Copper transport protein [Aphelenchoides besseyi]|nr:Copper transport protein [Aphelenchoides besseyi]KAI6227229.1 Copper transport protein [Aphelenchoides besseyi]
MSHDAHAHHHPPAVQQEVVHQHGMSHAMAFNFGTKEIILFTFWDVETALGLLLSCIAVLIGCVLLEGIRWYRAHRSNIRLNTAAGPEEESSRKRLDAWLITDTVLHAIQLVLAYLAMLVFMTFNVWLCIAVVVGEVGAHLIFRILWPHLDNMSNPVSFARPCCS